MEDNIIHKLTEQIKEERKNLNFNSSMRNNSLNDCKYRIKDTLFGTIVMTSVYFVMPLLSGSILEFISVLNVAVAIGSIAMAIGAVKYYFDFKKYCKKAIENSKMIDILDKKLEEEKTLNEEVSNIDLKNKLRELSEFIKLARDYSKNSDIYQTNYANDLDGYFNKETPHSLTMQGFIIDDMKRQKDFQKELKK